MSWNAIFRGAEQGMQLGDQVKNAVQDYQIAKIRAQGIAEAKAQQAADTPQVTDVGDAQNLSSVPQSSADPAAAPVNTDLQLSPSMQPAVSADGMQTAPVQAPEVAQDTSKLSSQPLASAPVVPAGQLAATPTPAAGGIQIKGGKRFQVGDASFDTADQAHAYAAKNAPSMDELLRKTLVPKMKEAYLAQGDTAKADAWDNWAQEGENKAYMKTWSKAYQAAQMGDYDSAADHLAKLHGQFADGYTITGREKATDKDGNVIGFKITGKKDGSDEETTQIVDPRALVEMGLGGLSPDKKFATVFQRQEKADIAGAKVAADVANDARTAAREKQSQAAIAARQAAQEEKRAANNKELARYNQGLDIEKHGITAQQDSARDTEKFKTNLKDRVAALRELGASEDLVTEAMTNHLGGTNLFRKPKAPEERRADIIADFYKHDDRFDPESEKGKTKIDKAYKAMYPDGPVKPGAAGGIPQAKPKPAPSTFPTAANGVPVYR